VALYPSATITCLDIDSDGCDLYNECEVYNLTFLVENTGG